jgi:hypothetical protein
MDTATLLGYLTVAAVYAAVVAPVAVPLGFTLLFARSDDGRPGGLGAVYRRHAVSAGALGPAQNG